MKYYLANTFLVATGDDPETESVKAVISINKATSKQVELICKISKAISQVDMERILKEYNVNSINDLNVKQADEIIKSNIGIIKSQ